jgi:A/G-specific adenine glycosylase
MTYHIQHLVLHAVDSATQPPTHTNDRAVWLDADGVESANIGTGVKKVWAEIYGSWGNFAKESNGSRLKVRKKPAAKVTEEGKIFKKVTMPAMPSRVLS